MKTLIFYSYKGGQGRSTGVANIASALYRLGKSVLVLDLDVESPGLPPKLIKESVFHGEQVGKAGGIVPYIIKLNDHVSSWGDPPSIENCAITVDDDEIRKFLLVPTGKVTANYESLLAEESWHTFSRRDKVSGHTYLNKRVRYLDAIRVAIEALQPPIDYLLVDLCSGITPLAQAVFVAWGGPILLFFSMDQENLEGTTHILAAINGVEELRNEVLGERDLPVTPYAVLSRLGPFISEERAAERRQHAAQELNIGFERVLYVRSDHELEDNWHLHFPLDLNQTPENAALTNDYLRIIATVLPEVMPSASIEGRIEKLRRSMKLEKEIDYHYKAFRLDEGVLINMSDRERNVSFKVNTFCSILDDFHRKMLADLAPKHRLSVKKVESEFDQAGLVSGRNFGKGLAKLWNERGDKDDLAGLLEFWCRFDSDVGFGVLSAKLTRRKPIKGWVRIKENFLAANRTTEDNPANLCALLSGYIAGVLREVTNKKFEVEHSLKHCMRTTKGRQDCEFTFKEARTGQSGN